MKTIYTTIILVAILINCNFINAQCTGNCLGYYPSTPLHLGAGFLINNPSQPFTSNFLNTIQTDTIHAQQTNFYCNIISNESSLKQALHVGGYLSVSTIAYDLDASFSVSSGSFYSSNSVTLALYANTDFGSVRIVNPTLNTNAQNYLNANGSDAFINHYGDNFISQEELGTSATLF